MQIGQGLELVHIRERKGRGRKRHTKRSAALPNKTKTTKKMTELKQQPKQTSEQEEQRQQQQQPQNQQRRKCRKPKERRLNRLRWMSLTILAHARKGLPQMCSMTGSSEDILFARKGYRWWKILTTLGMTRVVARTSSSCTGWGRWLTMALRRRNCKLAAKTYVLGSDSWVSLWLGSTSTCDFVR